MDIVDTIYSFLPAKRKQTPSGWTKFNAVCCNHNGQTADTRQRGGMIRNADGVSYHCFNCGFKASYQPGRHLTRKMRQLMNWLGVADDVINKLALEALKVESDKQFTESITLPTFENKTLPEDSRSFEEWSTFLSITGDDYIVPEGFGNAVEYVESRKVGVFSYPFYWSKSMPDRVIIPFYYQGRTVGYTARKLGDGKPKYLSDQTPGYVFNLDAQKDSRKFVIVVEGPFDAIAIEGVAILGADIMNKQAMMINRLDKQVILVPDRDKTGENTIEQALEQNWSVSMPDWEDCKDVNDAVIKYGKIAVLKSIIESAESSAIKIKLRKKSWFAD